jgi:threonine/homoserine/homoserine lactone efflux protein
MSFYILKGLVIGFSIAAPVGPVGLLCIRRSMAEGQRVGFVTGLGAATADASYGCVAAFGLTGVSSFLVGHRIWLSLIGGLFLCHLGVRTLINNPVVRPENVQAGSLLSAYLSTLFLTLTNPTTILSFVAVFAALGMEVSANYLGAGSLVAGVFIGSALWWLLLSCGAAQFQSRLDHGWMHFINRLSGSVIFAFGIYSLSTFWFR